MSKYASRTKVTATSSRGEIEKTLARYGANKFMCGYEEFRAVIAFHAKGRSVRFILPLPQRNQYNSNSAFDQDVRQKWRALVLAIKAKLECVETGITTFDAEFMAHIVIPNNRTVAEDVLPKIVHAYETGKMPELLPYMGAQ